MQWKLRPTKSDAMLLAFAAFFLVTALCFSAVGSSLAADQPPQEGELFPKLKFPVPSSPEHVAYLGLGSRKHATFSLGDVKARVVILEIFSMYCPYCQSEAPAVNKLHGNIAQRGLADKVKMIGIGAGNSSYEVDLFKKKYNVQFPLLPDNELAFHQALGNVRTPYFIVLALRSDGTQEVLYSRAGTIGDPEGFLDWIIQKTGPL